MPSIQGRPCGSRRCRYNTAVEPMAISGACSRAAIAPACRASDWLKINPSLHLGRKAGSAGLPPIEKASGIHPGTSLFEKEKKPIRRRSAVS